MAEMPLWLDAQLGERRGDAVEVTLTLARCRNCGQPKATSDPCSLDHLAALMEFGEVARSL